jgi:hypothetical protein
MKRIILILLCLCVFSLTVSAQTGRSGRRRSNSRSRARVVTVTGCIRTGVECLVLMRLDDNKQNYSIGKNDRLQVGSAYRITGTTTNVGICMQGMPILRPSRIVPLNNISCPRTTDGTTNTQ